MEFYSGHKIFQPNHVGEEKQQMLDLNRRLETYLNRVKLLEEENTLLAKELQVMRSNHQGASSYKKGLEEELRQARLDVDAVWRDRVLTQWEVGKLTEELQALDLQRQMEAQAKVDAKTKLQQSRKELEEEERAQIWLREKVSQLEYEMKLLVQTHKEDVAHLEATLTQTRATLPHTMPQTCNRTPSIRELGHEFSQRTTRAWQEAAEAYQGQLIQLEESLNQARSRLAQVNQEKHESHLKLQALEQEIISAQEVRMHLEKTADQQRNKHGLEIQKLQEYLGGLEVEKQDLGQQINHLLLENRDLLQMKMSLGLEVATYRALLDGESTRGNGSLVTQPRNITIPDAVFSPQGVKKNYQTQLSANRKTTSLSSIHSTAGPTVKTAAPVLSRQPLTLNEIPKISGKFPDVKKSTPTEASYPKILQDGVVENFRPQEVCEGVTYAEPLSPPNEEEVIAEKIASGDKEKEEEWNNVNDVEPKAVEPAVSYQVEPGLSSEPYFKAEVSQGQFAPPIRLREEVCRFPEELDKDVALEEEAKKEQHTPVDRWVKEECIGKETEHVHSETLDSETKAMLEPTFESSPSSPGSECEPVKNSFNQEVECPTGKNILNDDAAEISPEINSSTMGTNEKNDADDKLYPDGEEMDTWDSVIERKVSLKTDDGNKKAGIGQHAEPEEDISARELANEKTNGIGQDSATDEQQHHNMEKRADDQRHTEVEKEQVLSPDNDENDEEDSQNISMSWKTEVESDSYAQENTVADTRPLIRYKSDDTQASHMDESESSDGEQEKKMGETGAGMWSESKSNKFGTMEDLCEEVEEEAMDEECNEGSTHIENEDVGHGEVTAETGNAEEMIRTDEEAEEVKGHVVHSNEHCTDEQDEDEALETEQEVENLCTDGFSTHFTQQQISNTMLDMGANHAEETTVQEEAGNTKTEDVSTSDAVTNISYEPITLFRESSDVVAEEEIQSKTQEDINNPDSRQGDDHSESMVMLTDAAENPSDISDVISRPEMEEMSKMEDPNSLSPAMADQEVTRDVVANAEENESVHVDGITGQEEAKNTKTEDMSTSDAGTNISYEPITLFKEFTVVVAEEEIQSKTQEDINNPDSRQGDDHSESMLMHTDATEDPSGISDIISRPEMEEMSKMEDPNSLLPAMADQEVTQDVVANAEENESVHVEEITGQEEAENTKTENISTSESGMNVSHEPFTSTTITDHTCEGVVLRDYSYVMAYEEIQCKTYEDIDSPDKTEGEDEHNESMMAHTDATEDQFGITDSISQPEMEEMSKVDNPNSLLPATADPEVMHDAVAYAEETESVHMEANHAVGITGQEEAENTETEDMATFESGMNVNQELVTSMTIIDHTCGDVLFRDSSDVVAHEEIQCKTQEAINNPDKIVGKDDRNESMVTHTDASEDPSGINDFISRPELEDISKFEDPISLLPAMAEQEVTHDVAGCAEEKESVHVEASHSKVHSNGDCSDDEDEQLETEQEVENLCTDRYSTHFTQQQVSNMMLDMGANHAEETTGQEEVENTKTKDASISEPGMDVNQEPITSTMNTDDTCEDLPFRDSSVVVAQEEFQIVQEDIKNPDKREEKDDHSESMVTHTDATEEPSGISDFISRPELEEMIEDSNSLLPAMAEQEATQDMVACVEEKGSAAVEETSESQECLQQDAEDCMDVSEEPDMAEWEISENPNDALENRDQKSLEGKCDEVCESTDEGAAKQQKELTVPSPESLPNENTIFQVKDTTDLDDFFSGKKSDFWVSSLESGATDKPEDACNEAAGQTNQNGGFADSHVWENLEKKNVVNGISRMDIDSSEGLTATKEQEQMHAEKKQLFHRNVEEGDVAHSEESEVEGGAWSSGEELA
ncbi:nestin [Pholidichthys leucotaenia]